MSRKNFFGPKNVIDQSALAVNTNGTYSNCKQVDRVTYDFIWSNGALLNATGGIQKSHDGVNWITLDLLLPLTLSGASGSHTVIVEEIDYNYIRPIVSFVAGTCDLVVTVNGSSIGA